MRLSPAQTRVILNCVHQKFGTDASVLLFGSRLDDDARRADVDLLRGELGTRHTAPTGHGHDGARKGFALPVDIVAVQRGTPGSAFARIARSRAQLLGAAA